MPDVTLNIQFQDETIDPVDSQSDLFKASASLMGLINKKVAPAELPGSEVIRSGEKGMELAIGGILMQVAGSGLAEPLLDCIRAWFQPRDKVFKIIIVKNGNQIEINSSNIEPRQIEDLATRLEALLTR